MAVHKLTIALSAPTGFNARELLLPLKNHLEKDAEITDIVCISPAAVFKDQIFAGYSAKFTFIPQPGNANAMRELVQKYSINIVVTPTTGLDPNDVPILEGAALAGCPTLTFISSWDNVYKMERGIKQGRPFVIPDYFVVWNTYMKDHVLRLFPQLSAVMVRSIGVPRFDLFAQKNVLPSRAELLKHLSIPDDGGKLVHIATTELYPMEYIIRTLAHFTAHNQLGFPIHLFASVHPGGELQNHLPYARRYSIPVRYSFGRQEQAPLPEFLYNPTIDDMRLSAALFTHSDLLVNHSSTTAIESLLADVPVINVKYGRSFDWWRWFRSMVYRDFNEHYKLIVDSNGTTVVHNARQLQQAVTHALLHPEFKRAERAAAAIKLVTTTDGTAGSKLVAAIKEMARNHTFAPL